MNNTREYKELSKVSWLGSIPAEWDAKKIGSLFSQRKTKVSDKDFPPLSVSKAGVVPQLSTALKTNDGDNRKLVRAGDFVINSRSDRKGSCGIAKEDGSVSLINIVLTPRGNWDERYIHYLLRSQPFSEEYYRYACCFFFYGKKSDTGLQARKGGNVEYDITDNGFCSNNCYGRLV